MAYFLKNISLCKGGKRILDLPKLELPAKGLMVLLGPNGAGKSSLLTLLAGLEDSFQGELLWRGSPLKTQKAALRSREILWQGATPGEELPWSLEEYLLLGRYPWHGGGPGHQDREKAARALEAVGLSHAAQSIHSRLSTGEQKRAQMAQALASDASYWLLDEPLAHLEAPMAQAWIPFLAKWCRQHGIGILMSTHQLSPLLSWAEELILLKEGQLLGKGPPKKLLQKPYLKELFEKELFPL